MYQRFAHESPGPSYQSVSRTVAVCPRKRGKRSGSLPLCSSGITAKAPPPPASQLTDKYLGLTCPVLVCGNRQTREAETHLYDVAVPGVL